MSKRSSKKSIGYAKFGAWYDEQRAARFEPGLEVAIGELDALLHDALSERDLTRIRRTSGRVKSKQRAWRKLQPILGNERLSTVDEIPHHLHDLVGLRITCTNLRDIEMIQSALESLGDERDQSALSVEPSSERNYVVEPKESGYRGWHVVLGLELTTEDGTHSLRVELQVRTLLQDAWGELTHEDAYSKRGSLPPLVDVLSTRMADLFSTLDDIAEDLRAELDRLDEETLTDGRLGEPPSSLDGDADDADDTSERDAQSLDAASILQARWTHLDRPVELASLAWQLQQEFGAEISEDWFGHRSFKRFVQASIPEGEISTGRQAFLLPAETEKAATEADTATPSTSEPSAIPAAARELRRIDKGFPLLESDAWPVLFEVLAEAWRRVGSAETAQQINRITRSARDRSQTLGKPMSRRYAEYVVRAVIPSHSAAKPLDASAIEEAFVRLTLQRMIDLRVIGARDRKQQDLVADWLSSSS